MQNSLNEKRGHIRLSQMQMEFFLEFLRLAGCQQEHLLLVVPPRQSQFQGAAYDENHLDLLYELVIALYELTKGPRN